MSHSRCMLIVVSVLFALTVLACGSMSPPESCGERVGGTADESLFAKHYRSMDLVDEATGQAGAEGEEGTG